MVDRTRMTRRAGLALIGAGVATAIPYTRGMTSTVADRLANVETAEDPDAVLGIQGIGESPRDQITVVNNGENQLDVTVTTTNLRIESSESDHEAFFSLEPTEPEPLEFAPENGNVDDVAFEATILDGTAPTGTIELQRSITVPPEPATTYRIENIHSGLVMGTELTFDWPPSIYYDVVQQNWNESEDQQWTIQNNQDGTKRIQNVGQGEVLGIQDGSTQNEASVVLRPWDGSDDRRWTMVPNADGSYRLVNENSGLAADVEGASTDDGANVIQWPWKGDDAVANQKWVFKPV